MIAFANQLEPESEPNAVGECLRPQPGPQEKFLSTPADIAIYGGAAGGGKTFAELLEPCRHLGNPNFGAVIFRRTTPEITNQGGLWDESFNIYPLLGGTPSVGNLRWTFPSGARVEFDHLQHETDKKKYQGSQIPCIEFDEVTHFTETQFWYLLSRNRSTCGVRPYMRATCNPDAASWVAKLIAWWIDQRTGYPIPERSGVVRWFVRASGAILWGDTKEECCKAAIAMGVPAEKVKPKSFTFIAAKLEDNPALIEKDPDYEANLLAQSTVEQERLLSGNWKIADTEGSEWPAEYFEEIWAEWWPDAFELSCVVCDPSKGKEKGDYSAIVFIGLSGGTLWVDADIEKRPVPEIVADTGAMVVAYGAEEAGFETNGFQELLAPEFERYCRDSGLPPYPVTCIENYSIDKKIRIRRLGGWLKGKRFRFKRTEGCELLLMQLMQFPLGEHDDGPDALEMGVRRLNAMAAESLATANETELVP